jgi:NADPH2:quinone reductase
MSTTIHQLPGFPLIDSSASAQIEVADKVAQHPPRRGSAPAVLMNAAFILRTGEPGVIQYGRLPRPVPAPGQVLIRVGAAAVNPIDVEIRSGRLAMPLRFPYVIGSDVAGTVVMRGIGVRRFAEGDRVWGSNQGVFGRQGTFAEYVAVDEKWLYPIPMQQSDAEAAAGAMVGITACLGLFRAARLCTSEIVFVQGDAGGVGSAILQQAKAAGARVITTAGDPATDACCRELKADLVLDCRSPNLYEQIREFAEPFGGVHVWAETQREPMLNRIVELMASGGRIVMIASQGANTEVSLKELYSANLSLLGVSMFNTLPDVQRQCAMAINERYTYGRWRPRVGLTLSLSQAAEAQQTQEMNIRRPGGAVHGKIVVVPNS